MADRDRLDAGVAVGPRHSPARDHWQRYLPRRLAALEDPDAFFDALEDEAQACHAAIRDGLLKGLNPNDGTIGWAEFVTQVDQVNATAREIVGHELIFIPGETADDEGDER